MWTVLASPGGRAVARDTLMGCASFPKELQPSTDYMLLSPGGRANAREGWQNLANNTILLNDQHEVK